MVTIAAQNFFTFSNAKWNAFSNQRFCSVHSNMNRYLCAGSHRHNEFLGSLEDVSSLSPEYITSWEMQLIWIFNIRDSWIFRSAAYFESAQESWKRRPCSSHIPGACSMTVDDVTRWQREKKKWVMSRPDHRHCTGDRLWLIGIQSDSSTDRRLQQKHGCSAECRTFASPSDTCPTNSVLNNPAPIPNTIPKEPGLLTRIWSL